MRVRVECYSGYKADQRPLRFYLGDRCLEVREVCDQWYSPAADYFRVQAEDGQTYVLKRDWSGNEEVWTLEAYRRVASCWPKIRPQVTRNLRRRLRNQ